MFGMVASAALSILSQVTWTQRTMLIFGVALSVGVGSSWNRRPSRTCRTRCGPS